MTKRRTLSKGFGGQVWNTGGALFSSGEAHAPPVKQLRMPFYTMSAAFTITVAVEGKLI